MLGECGGLEHILSPFLVPLCFSTSVKKRTLTLASQNKYYNIEKCNSTELKIQFYKK